MSTRRHGLRYITVIVLCVASVLAPALSPLWFPACPQAQLSNAEKADLQSHASRPHSEAFLAQRIPCGAEALSADGKLYAARHRDAVLHEMPAVLIFPVLRLDLRPTPAPDQPLGLLQFTGYTFFYIPILHANAGGSGYMEVYPLGPTAP